MKALVRRPSSRLAEGIVTHIDRVPVDVDLAVRQWEQYVRVLCEAGWEIIEVPEALDCPDSAFIEDAMVAFRNVAVIARPGADSRKPEILEVEKVVESIGCSINRIRAPGTLDGGDVLKVGDTVYVGRGGRTNGEGIRQLRAILEPIGATVVAVPLAKALHLKPTTDGRCPMAPSSVGGRWSTMSRSSLASSLPRRSPVPTWCCWATIVC